MADSPNNSIDLHQFLVEFQDYLAPKLDTYEQAIYLYVFRHTRFVGSQQAVIGFKSARARLAVGIGEHGKPMSEGSVARKLQSLERKGCIKVVGSERNGRRIQLMLPAEVPGIVVKVGTVLVHPDDEALDFFSIAENRGRILQRENNRCFYCLREIGPDSYVIEHVVSRPEGDSGYRNVVAACRGCNNRKKTDTADEWLRVLYREGLLSDDEFKARRSCLDRLRAGELRPPPLVVGTA